MSKTEAVLTENAPKPIGPYSQAIKAGGFLFCSGQVPLDPKTGELVGSNVEEQTVQVMKNLKGVFDEAGASFDNGVRFTIFLKDMNDFPKVNEIYGSYFTGTAPARACVEVSRLPKDVMVEIDALVAL